MSYDIGVESGLTNSEITASLEKAHDMPDAADVTASKAETDRLKEIKPAATVQTLAAAVALAESGNLSVGGVVSVIDFGVNYQLIDAGSSISRPDDLDYYIYQVGSVGLYLEIIDVIYKDRVYTVGSGGDYLTINSALSDIQLSRKAMNTENPLVKINLLAGFEMSEQIICDGIDLSWVTITSDDAEVVIIRSSLNTTNIINLDYDSAPAFLGVNGGKLPQISALFTMDLSGIPTGKHGVMLAWGGFCHVARDCGVKNAGERGLYAVNSVVYARDSVWDGAGTRGIRIGNASTANIRGASAVGCGEYNLAVAGASNVCAQDGVFSGCLNTATNGANVLVHNAASVLLDRADLSGSASNSLIVESGCTGSAESANLSGAARRAVDGFGNGNWSLRSANCTNAGDRAINIVNGGNLNAYNVDGSGFGGSYAFAVFSGAEVSVSGAIGSTNVTPVNNRISN